MFSELLQIAGRVPRADSWPPRARNGDPRVVATRRAYGVGRGRQLALTDIQLALTELQFALPDFQLAQTDSQLALPDRQVALSEKPVSAH